MFPPRLVYQEIAGARPFHAALVLVNMRTETLGAHSHSDFHEFIYVIDGQGTCTTNGDPSSVSGGDILLARPDDVHDFKVERLGRMTFINIAFPSRTWRAFTDMAGVDPMRTWDHATSPPTGHDSGEKCAAAFHLALAAYVRGPRPLDLIRFWTAITDRLDGADESGDLRPGWLVAACDAMNIEEHLRDGLDCFRQLAAVSPAHLSRSMANHYGCTPVEFVTERRLAQASMLLSSTTEAIGTIALRCGFTGHSYFDRKFKAAFGCSPRDYRDEARRAVVP